MRKDKELKNYAKSLGWEFHRQGKRHKIYRHSVTGKKMPLPCSISCHRGYLNIRSDLKRYAAVGAALH